LFGLYKTHHLQLTHGNSLLQCKSMFPHPSGRTEVHTLRGGQVECCYGLTVLQSFHSRYWTVMNAENPL